MGFGMGPNFRSSCVLVFIFLSLGLSLVFNVS